MTQGSRGIAATIKSLAAPGMNARREPFDMVLSGLRAAVATPNVDTSSGKAVGLHIGGSGAASFFVPIRSVAKALKFTV